MKYKLSVSIDREKIVSMQDLIRKGIFRNKSHIVEYAVSQLLKGKER